MIIRGLMLAALALVSIQAAFTADEALAWDSIDALANEFNPAQQSSATEFNPFTGNPITELAVEIRDFTVWSFYWFLPFLIGPQILILYVIFKFRNNGSDRKPATFIHNNKLEAFWTILPIIWLIFVAVPVGFLTAKMEAVPQERHSGDSLVVEIVGKKFDWIYQYPGIDGVEAINTYPLDFAPYGLEKMVPIQESAVFVKDKVAECFLSSRDVIHAWGVNAFGVKKDCFPDKVNFTWFLPNRSGFYEGHCYELCGALHGFMILSAVVTEEENFDKWVGFQRHRNDAAAVIRVALKDEDVKEAIEKYFKNSQSASRENALRYWLAYDHIAKASFLSLNGNEALASTVKEAYAKKQNEFDIAIKGALALHATSDDVLAVNSNSVAGN